MKVDWSRLILAVALFFFGYVLLQYLPLLPKASVAMDDLHYLRTKADTYDKTANDVKTSIDGMNVEIQKIAKQFWFLKEDAKRRGQPWPNQ